MGSRQHGTRGHHVHEGDAAVLGMPTEALLRLAISRLPAIRGCT